MKFGDNGFETELDSYQKTCLKEIITNGWIFNKVPIVFDSPAAELEAFQQTLQDQYDNFWSPFEEAIKAKSDYLNNDNYTMLHNSIKVGSFGMKVFAKLMKVHSVEDPLHYKSNKDTKDDLAKFRF